MNTSNNQKKDIIAEENNKLEEWLLNNSCCGQEMVLTETNESEDNKVCLKYDCSKCKKTIFSNETKKPKAIILTLTPEQYEELLANHGNSLRIIHENKKEIY